MICNKCNTENAADSKFCFHCGNKLEENSAAESKPIEETSVQATLDAKTPEVTEEQSKVDNSIATNNANKFSIYSILSLVISLVGFIVFAIVCGIVGLCFAIIAMRETETNPQIKGRGLAIAGLVLSIIDIVTFFLYMLI